MDVDHHVLALSETKIDRIIHNSEIDIPVTLFSGVTELDLVTRHGGWRVSLHFKQSAT